MRKDGNRNKTTYIYIHFIYKQQNFNQNKKTMKKLFLLTKTLLAVVLLCVGQNAWGETVTTYNFKLLGPAGATFSWDGSVTCYYAGSSGSTRSFSVANDFDVDGFPTLNGLLASYTGDLNVHATTGIYSANGRQCSLNGLCPGTKVIFEYTAAGAGNDVIQYSTSAGYGYAFNGVDNNLEAWETIASGDEITITHGTYLCFLPKKNVRIASLTIKTPDTDDEAAANMVAVNNNRYNVTEGETITCGKQIKSVAGITFTYGGLDGTNTWTASSTTQTGLTDLGYQAIASTNAAPQTSAGGRANAKPNLPAKGNFYMFEPMVNGELAFAGLFTASRNTFCVSSDWEESDKYNPTSNSYGAHTFTLNAGNIYYIWTDNALYGSIAGFTFTPTSVPVEVTDAGYATYVPSYDLDFSATGIKAYKVKVNTKGVATMTPVDNVPAGTPVLLYKEGGATENIPVMTGAATVTDNDLVAGPGAAVATTDGEYTNMILNVVDEKIGFYFANGQTVAANRAYLHIATSLAPDAVGGGARMSMRFAGDITGVENVEAASEAEPKDGKFIENGKLVIVKNGQKFNAAGAKLY